MQLRHAGVLFSFVCATCVTAQASAEEPKPVPESPRLASADGGTSTINAESATLEEVVVTAERREADIQNTAVSVSVRKGDELAAQGRYTTRQILQDVPGITAVDNGSANAGSSDVQGNNITIRGVSPGTSAGGGASALSATPATAVYVDGVYEGIGSNYDIDRVEVLRGPQGTLYGRSATAGVLAFHTRNPNLQSFEGNAAVEVGDYDLQHYTAAVNLPVASTLAVRLAGDYRDQDEGYYGEATHGKGQTTDGRAKVLWKPADTLSVLLGVAYEKSVAYTGGNSSTANLARVVTTISAETIPSEKQSREYWAELNWDLGPVTLTYMPAFRTWAQDDHLLDQANFVGSGDQLQQQVQTPLDQFHTQELRIASKGDSMLQWQGGAFYYHNQLHTSNYNYFVGTDGAQVSALFDTIDRKDTKNLGFFAESTLSLTNAMRVTLGVRYDDTQVTVSEYYFQNPYGLCGTTAAFTVVLPAGASCIAPGVATVAPPAGTSINNVGISFHNFNYKARFEYDLTPKNMAFAMISTGFRPGDAGIANQALNVVDAEKLTSIEIGSKNRFFQDSLQLNAGLYLYEYHGFQTSYIPDTPNPLDPATGQNTVNLTVPSQNVGGELEALYQLTSQDRVGVNYSYVSSFWYNQPAAFEKAQPETHRALTPHTVTANYEHIFNLPGGSKISGRIDGEYDSPHLSTNLHVDYLRLGFENYVELGSRTTGNLTGTWASAGGNYSVSAYMHNFTNEKQVTYGFAADPNNPFVNWSDPRTYGVIVSARF